MPRSLEVLMQANKILLLTFTILTISSCGESSDSSITGNYACKDKTNNAYTLEIADGGTGVLSMDNVGKSAAGKFTYTQEGEKIRMSGASGNMEFMVKNGELKPLSFFTTCSKK